MSYNNVYDGYGRRIGQTNSRNDVTYAQDSSGRNLGYYNKKSNTTFDANGRRVGTGDMSNALILDNARKKN